ncbi:MAG: sugar ABC transporter permease [candidate division NC10 bacterium]|nr:sugar ABC transporter permease [candidate division NC10 bacterium]
MDTTTKAGAKALSLAPATRAALVNGRRPTSRRLAPWLLVAPTLLVMLATSVFPLAYSLVVSFTRYELARETGWEFVGLVNYRDALRDQRFLASAVQTAQIIGPALVTAFVLGFALALLLNRPFGGRGLFVSLLAVPIMVAPTAGAMSFGLMLTPKYGAVNDLLSILVGQRLLIDWLGSPGLARFSVAVVQVWRWAPFYMLVLLAGLQAIPDELYEAGRIDGASPVQLFGFITVPLLRWPALVGLLIGFIDLIKIFDTVYIMTTGGPGGSTETLTFYTYYTGVRFFHVGYGAALSFYVLAAVLLLCVLLVRASGRREEGVA